MKQDKNTLYYKKILKYLSDGGVYTILQISEGVGLSEKTVRTKIDQVNDWLVRSEMGKIEKKQGTGIWLEIDESQREAMREYLLADENLSPALQPDDRERQLMGKLLKLKPGQTTTLQQLADSLYLSAPTVGALIRKINGWFEAHHLQIVSMRNRGVCLFGNEYSIRIAIKDYMTEVLPEVFEALFETFAPGVDAARLRRIVVDAENAWRIELTDSSFQMVWIMTCLSLARRPYVNTDTIYTGEENVRNYNEYSFAESIYKRMEQVYRIQIPENDIMQLATLLLTAKKLKNFGGTEENDYAKQYDENLEELVHRIIDTISSVLDIELREDNILYESLLMHLRAAVFRMKYSTHSDDSISKYVKNEYKQIFLATWSTSSLFEEYFDVQVTEDELAGIALYIQAAMIRRKKGHPLSALLISDVGMGANQLSIEMLKYNIPELTRIHAVSRHDFRLSQYPDMDIIINMSTARINDNRVVEVGSYLNQPQIEQVRRKANQITSLRKKANYYFHNICHQLFDVDLIFLHPKAQTKDELIACMVKKMEEKGNVTSKYLESVLERERATTTCIGRGVAIPHGNMSWVNESRIVVTVLDKPIYWNDEYVDVIFLLAVKMTSQFEIRQTKQFYKDFIRLTDDDNNMELIRKMDSAMDVYQYFIK